jgi:chemotaxis protein methyltransferase WspC
VSAPRASAPGATPGAIPARSPAQPVRAAQRQQPKLATPTAPRRSSLRPPARRSKRAPSLRPSSRARARQAAGLDEARALADRGELAAALELCESHLARKGPSAAAFCLQGVIKQAGGDARGARESFDKAVYMDGRHYEALSHIALLCEHAGDTKAASHWRRRAESARKENA